MADLTPPIFDSENRDFLRVKSCGALNSELTNPELLDYPTHVRSGDIVERVLVFLFQATAKIFSGDIACFAIGKVSSGASAKFHEARVRQSQHHSFTIH